MVESYMGVVIALYSSVAIAIPGIPVNQVETPQGGPEPAQAVVTEVEPPQPSPEEIKLAEFLRQKGSPMPAGVLLQYPNWKMILAVSNAESSMGRKNAGSFNAYGIKYFGRNTATNKHGRYRNFSSWEESIAFASQLLYKYDPEDGSPSPQGMVRRWKAVAPFDGWLRNVHGTLAAIEKAIS